MVEGNVLIMHNDEKSLFNINIIFIFFHNKYIHMYIHVHKCICIINAV